MVFPWCYHALEVVSPENSIFLHFGTATPSKTGHLVRVIIKFGEYKVKGPDVKISKNGSVLLVEPLSSRGAAKIVVRAVSSALHGAASALKMSYAGLTKGLIAIGVAMLAGARRAGLSVALRAELEHSQPELLRMLRARVPAMFPRRIG